MSSEKAFGAPLGNPFEINEPLAGNIGLCMINNKRKIEKSRVQDLSSVGGAEQKSENFDDSKLKNYACHVPIFMRFAQR